MTTLVLVYAVGCGGLGSDGARAIRFPQAVNAQHPRVVVSREFGDRLERATGGRLKLTLFPGGQLYSARKAVEACALGDVEMALEPETHFITFDDAFRAVDVPFQFEDDAAFHRFLAGPFRDRVASSLEERGLVLLDLWDEGPMVLGAREDVLRTPEAFQNVKIRSSGHDFLARTWNHMGATTVRLPLEEVYTALQQGVTDAIYTTLYTFVSGKFHEVAPKVVVWPARATYVWVVNRAFWNGLSEDDRAAVRRLVEEASDAYHAELRDTKAEMIATIEAAPDGELTILSAEEIDVLRAPVAEMVTEWQSEYADVLASN